MKSTLTDKQFTLARQFERAGLTTISQAVKAFERGEDARIKEWKRLLAVSQTPWSDPMDRLPGGNP